MWHNSDDKPDDGRWILVFYPLTKTPTVVKSDRCVELMNGCVWAYVQELLKIV